MRLKGIPAAAVVVVLSAIVGGVFGARTVSTQDRVSERYRIYTAALAAIESEYVESVEATQLVEGSIDGMLRTLDPHSNYLTARDYARMREQQEGRYPGIGISIVKLNGEITVLSLFEGSPAYRAGIRRNDVIARVGKRKEPGAPGPDVVWEETKGWETEDVVKRVRGPQGHDHRDLDSPARRRYPHRSDRRARSNQDHDRADGVHDCAGYRLRPAAGLFGNHQRGAR